MGLGDLIGDAIDSVETATSGAAHVAGTVADAGGQVASIGLNALGMHGLASSAQAAGETVADRFGDQVPEAQLGQSSDPTHLIHGDVAAIGRAVTRLRGFATAFTDTAHGLTGLAAGLDSGQWQGSAADAFRQVFTQHPPAWTAAADACTSAANAWEDFGQTVTTAQHQAQQAITAYQQAQHITTTAQARYNDAVSAYQQRSTDYLVNAGLGRDPGPIPQAPAAFVDPGAAGRAQAEQLLTDARHQRDSAGAQVVRVLTGLTNSAPPAPSRGQRVADDLGDSGLVLGVEDEHVIGGAVKGTGDMVKLGRSIIPVDPYNATHPADYVDGLSKLGAGLVHLGMHPQDLIGSVVGSGWGSDPAEALGRLIPNVLAGVGSDGAAEAGVAAKAADTAGAAAKTGETAEAGEVAADADRAGAAGVDHGVPQPRSAPVSELPAPVEGKDAWGEFGPEGETGLGAADAQAGGAIERAGGGLAGAEHDLDQIHVHDTGGPAGSTSPASAASSTGDAPVVARAGADGLTPAAGSARSVIQRRLDGLDPAPTPVSSDASVATKIADSGAGLGRAEHDLDEIHVHAPEGPEANNPDYSDPRYQAGSGTQLAYRRAHPLTAQDKVWLRNTREDWPAAAALTDPELLAIGNLTTTEAPIINSALRSGDQSVLRDYDVDIRNAVSGLNKLPSYTGVVSRGIKVPPSQLEDVLDHYSPGETVTQPAFTSSSMAVPYSGNVQFTIESTGGKDISSLLYGQREVVFPPGEKFTVVGRAYNPVTQQWNIRLRDTGR